MNLAQPKLPTGSMKQKAKTAAGDTVGAIYSLGVLGVAGLAVYAGYRFAKAEIAKRTGAGGGAAGGSPFPGAN